MRVGGVPLGEVEIGPDVIWFAGGCETFCLNRTGNGLPESYERKPYAMDEASQRRRRFSFCKTSRLPYDVIVVAVLCAAKDRWPALDVSSDGSLAERKDGFDLFERATGRKPVDWEGDAEARAESEAALTGGGHG